MPSPRGFDDPALASIPPAGNLYFTEDVAVAAKITGEEFRGGRIAGQQVDVKPPPLMYGTGQALTSEGAPIVNAANSSRGHVSEILNFHGSPAPWILLGILLAAGLLHLSAQGKFKGEL